MNPPLPECVQAMLDDDHAPTAPLLDYIDAETAEGKASLWWRLDPGHQRNLFEAAVLAYSDTVNRLCEAYGLDDADRCPGCGSRDWHRAEGCAP